MARKPDGELRRGWTTGACAAGAARAAFTALLTGRFPDPVAVELPKGHTPAFALAEHTLGRDWAAAAIIKDGGDDPDVTHGCTVRATVTPARPGAGVRFHAGDGIGHVTRPGLPIPPHEPAINPVPRRLMRAAIADVAAAHGGSGDVAITLAIPGGAELAAQTLNPRLGIEGGLSVLGTTGVVIPYSCSSWIHSIHRGIDAARAEGLDHVAGSTGSTSEAVVQREHALPDTALLDMGDFAGGTLKYLRDHPVPRLTIAGGFGKLAKLAAGSLDLHASQSRVDPAFLATLLRTAGADGETVARAETLTTAGEILALAQDRQRPLGDAVAEAARASAQTVAGDATRVGVLVVDRGGEIVGRADA